MKTKPKPRPPAEIDRLMADFFASGKPWGKHPDLTAEEFRAWLCR